MESPTPSSTSSASPVSVPSDLGDQVILDGRYAGLVKKKKGRLAALKAGTRIKSNSTSTLYVSETLQSPDINGLLLRFVG